MTNGKRSASSEPSIQFDYIPLNIINASKFGLRFHVKTFSVFSSQKLRRNKSTVWPLFKVWTGHVSTLLLGFRFDGHVFVHTFSGDFKINRMAYITRSLDIKSWRLISLVYRLLKFTINLPLFLSSFFSLPKEIDSKETKMTRLKLSLQRIFLDRWRKRETRAWEGRNALEEKKKNERKKTHTHEKGNTRKRSETRTRVRNYTSEEENMHVRRKTRERKENRVGNTRVSKFKEKRVRRETDKQASEKVFFESQTKTANAIWSKIRQGQFCLHYETRCEHLCTCVTALFSGIERFSIVFTWNSKRHHVVSRFR